MSLLYEAIDFSYSMAEDELTEPLQLMDLTLSPEPKSDVRILNPRLLRMISRLVLLSYQ